MRGRSAVGVVALVALAGGCNSGFSVGIDVSEPCPMGAAQLIFVATAQPGNASDTKTVDMPDAFFAGNHRIVIVPPAGASGIHLSVTAVDASGSTVGSGMVDITVTGHQLFETNLEISGICLPDGGVPMPDGPACTLESCSGATPYCDTQSGFCAACLTSDHCPDGHLCQAGKCVPGCNGMHGCGDGGSCEIDAGRCLVCQSDSDCGGATPRCDTTDGRCVVCLPQMDNCPEGQKCIPDKGGAFRCAQGCKNDKDCMADGGPGSLCCTDVCIDTTSDDNNCGACNHPCGPSQGCCGATCFDLTVDINNCGACGNVCNLAHATAICSVGKCQISSCNVGYADCDQSPSTGCEKGITGDILNCGGCGIRCPGTHVDNSGCANMACVGTCSPGYKDCDNHLAQDGCEVFTDGDPDNCGGCGMVCSNQNIMQRRCDNGICDGPCSLGFGDCDHDPSNGCEDDTNGDKNNCGGCGKVCSNQNINASCVTGMCSGTCDQGYEDCDNNLLLDGCETNTASDPNNCGGCGRVCSSQNVPQRMCGGGKCSGSCANGFADCNNDKLTDGCEADLTMVATCGGCSPCAAVPNGGPLCTNEKCVVGLCVTPYADCDGIYANGCEANLATSDANCGKCGTICGNGLSCVQKSCMAVKRVFVSSTVFTGNMGGFAGADQACLMLAKNAGLGGSWKAWVSDRNNPVASRFVQAVVPYVLVDGTPLAPNFTGLALGLMHPISLDERGNPPPPAMMSCTGASVYTNTNENGTASGANDCKFWSDVNANGVVGDTTHVDPGWTANCLNTPCTGHAPIYCFEQ